MQPNNDSLLTETIFDQQVDIDAQAALKTISTWAYITGGCSLASILLTFINVILTKGYNAEALIAYSVKTNFLPWVMQIILNVFLLQMAGTLKKAINDNDQYYFNTGLRKMAAYFKALGIILIVVAVLVIIAVAYVFIQNKKAQQGLNIGE